MIGQEVAESNAENPELLINTGKHVMMQAHSMLIV